MLGAGAARKLEASIARAARAMGHPCQLVDVSRLTQAFGRPVHPLIERRIEAFAPDTLILTRHAWLLGEARLRRLFRHRTAVLWYVDVIPRDEVVALGRVAGTLYHTCPGQLEWYRRAGVPEVRFLPQAVDPFYDRPGLRRDRYACDVSFVGSGQYPHRWPLLRAMAREFRVQIRGMGWEEAPRDLPVAGGPVWGRRFGDAVASAAVSLGANALPEQDAELAATSNRLWKVLGSGGFFLGRRGPGVEHYARDGLHCGWYRTEEEAVERARAALADPDRHAAIARAGREHALRHHTYAHRLRALLAGEEHPRVAGRLIAATG